MNFLDKLERRYGKYALRDLPMIMLVLYVIGYLLESFLPQVLYWCTLEPALILQGQVWRIFTWVLVPPSSLDVFTIIMLYFYFSLGRMLEQTWGAFRFNVYIFSGFLFTVAGSFLLYLVYWIIWRSPMIGFGSYFSTYYINMSIFLAFAVSYPDLQVMLYFLIPIKVKWMGMIYGAFLIYDCFLGGWPTRVAVLASLMNFLLYFLSTRNIQRYRPSEIHRRNTFKRNVKKVRPASGTAHKCAVCGRTEKDGDHLEFRYCSKCDGNYEYCQDHLFTHTHIKKG